MSKIKCDKCCAEIKIKTLFLDEAGCENCGNKIDFSTMSELSGMRQGLLLGVAVFVGVILFIIMLKMHVTFSELPELIMGMSAQMTVYVLIVALVLVIIVAEIEKALGCSIYEKKRIQHEELEREAEARRLAEEQEQENE
ncbi:MAG: hypothetical protein LUG52_09710 [Clostridia bacterium]|nr:hypothetical protein [Clostridia bacterium]